MKDDATTKTCQKGTTNIAEAVFAVTKISGESWYGSLKINLDTGEAHCLEMTSPLRANSLTDGKLNALSI